MLICTCVSNSVAKLHIYTYHLNKYYTYGIYTYIYIKYKNIFISRSALRRKSRSAQARSSPPPLNRRGQVIYIHHMNKHYTNAMYAYIYMYMYANHLYEGRADLSKFGPLHPPLDSPWPSYIHTQRIHEYIHEQVTYTYI